MCKFVLKNFEKWKTLNKGKDFSLFDYIFQIMLSKEINNDIFFAFVELFWPSFIIYDDYILLKENFSETKFKELVNNKEKIEFWMNFLTIDPYFEDDEAREEKAENLTQVLVAVWQSKLKKDFPDLEFTVEYLSDIKSGDYGLTFYQMKLPLKEKNQLG